MKSRPFFLPFLCIHNFYNGFRTFGCVCPSSIVAAAAATSGPLDHCYTEIYTRSRRVIFHQYSIAEAIVWNDKHRRNQQRKKKIWFTFCSPKTNDNDAQYYLLNVSEVVNRAFENTTPKKWRSFLISASSRVRVVTSPLLITAQFSSAAALIHGWPGGYDGRQSISPIQPAGPIDSPAASRSLKDYRL